jgi:UMF1 family MFS transporter
MAEGLGSGRPLLARLALHRPELRAWAMYDWANSAMVTIIVTAIFPIFFASVAWPADSERSAAQVYAWATTISLVIVALLAPVLGTVADRTRSKKKLLMAFVGAGVLACAGMFFIRPGQWQLAAALFMLANIGASGSFVFYDALLPHVARRGEMDQLSTSSFALGYLGGGLLLALNLAWIREPQWFGLPSGEGLTLHEKSLPARMAFLSVAVWWSLFTLPLLRRVDEPEVSESSEGRGSFGGALMAASVGLRATMRDLLRYPQAALMLLAFLFYNDGIMTFIRMASVYGEELQLDRGEMMLALLMVQFVGVPCTFLFGWIATRVGAKRSVLFGLGVYFLVGLLAHGLDSGADFFLMAGLVALVQGGTQALSRSLFASMIPRSRSGEFFGLFAVFDRFAGIFGPFLFAQVLLWTGDIRDAVLPLLAFFVVGAGLLALVRVDEGRRAVGEG